LSSLHESSTNKIVKSNDIISRNAARNYKKQLDMLSQGKEGDSGMEQHKELLYM